MTPLSPLPSAPAASEPVSLGKSDAAPEIAPVQNVPWWRCGVVLGLTAVVVFAYWINPPLFVPPEAGVVMKLPTQVGDYHGLKGAISKAESEGLPKDTEFARKEYFDSSGDDILATIVLAGAGQNSIHRPEACLEGQGWDQYANEVISVPLRSGHALPVKILYLQRQEMGADQTKRIQRRLYMYWFVGENVTTANHMMRVWVGSWDRVMHNRAHRWAFVIATAAVGADQRPGGKSIEETKTLLTDFIRDAVPAFQKSEMVPE